MRIIFKLEGSRTPKDPFVIDDWTDMPESPQKDDLVTLSEPPKVYRVLSRHIVKDRNDIIVFCFVA